ncbi:endonuclease/exonuclease/phosphatase family protein [Enterovibrio sp. ZSDZ35]|uniref:Endonuclease/exonuclease/phosphatase family protein n=1 Tax=Enterovibrio qingdaonensis TaxID=2899818 RepID=A0ABT5QFP8_9GAMM|nr:endonuclease/exonuclease/phosphatase family protein [Enterovibrio sp. ZSDZ35]MDD1779803.1 endonuclease/exonuclease/phosphatase family protein [Enterovibrio sp. ZSDZ35]
MTFRLHPRFSKLIHTACLAVVVAASVNVKHAFASLTLATWNMEWLSDKGDIIQGQRKADDYLMMQTVVSVLNADLVAFQEVDSLYALSKVLNPNEYNFFLSDRAKYYTKSRGSNQFTGWAVRKGIQVIDHADYKPLGLPTFLSRGNLRYGTYIEVVRDNQPSLHLLSIHLKSGCFETPVRRNNSCKKLERQVDALSVWIKTRQELGQEFIIAGDFNHYMNINNEWVWESLVKGAGKDNLVNLSEFTQAKCKARRFNFRTKRWEQVVYDKLIDHIIASPGAISSDITPLAKQFRYSYHTVANYRLSDHCPVYVEL